MADHSSPLKHASAWMWLWIVLAGLSGGSLAVLVVSLFDGQTQAVRHSIPYGLVPGFVYFAGARFRPDDLHQHQPTHTTIVMLLGLYIVGVCLAIVILLLSTSPSIEHWAYNMFGFISSSIGGITPPFWYAWRHTGR